ncbi:unnamed protein product, partial [Notodromas monacha]
AGLPLCQSCPFPAENLLWSAAKRIQPQAFSFGAQRVLPRKLWCGQDSILLMPHSTLAWRWFVTQQLLQVVTAVRNDCGNLLQWQLVTAITSGCGNISGILPDIIKKQVNQAEKESKAIQEGREALIQLSKDHAGNVSKQYLDFQVPGMENRIKELESSTPKQQPKDFSKEALITGQELSRISNSSTQEQQSTSAEVSMSSSPEQQSTSGSVDTTTQEISVSSTQEQQSTSAEVSTSSSPEQQSTSGSVDTTTQEISVSSTQEQISTSAEVSMSASPEQQSTSGSVDTTTQEISVSSTQEQQSTSAEVSTSSSPEQQSTSGSVDTTTQEISVSSTQEQQSTSAEVSTSSSPEQQSTSGSVDTTTQEISVSSTQEQQSTSAEVSTSSSPEQQSTSGSVDTTTQEISVSSTQEQQSTSAEVSTSSSPEQQSTSGSVDTTTQEISVSSTQEQISTSAEVSMSASPEQQSTSGSVDTTTQEISVSSTQEQQSTSAEVSTSSSPEQQSTSGSVDTTTQEISVSSTQEQQSTSAEVSTSSSPEQQSTSGSVDTTTQEISVSSSQEQQSTSASVETTNIQEVSSSSTPEQQASSVTIVTTSVGFSSSFDPKQQSSTSSEEIDPGRLLVKECPTGMKGAAEWLCRKSGTWDGDLPNLSGCRNLALENVLIQLNESNNVANEMKELASMIQNSPGGLAPGDLYDLSAFFELSGMRQEELLQSAVSDAEKFQMTRDYLSSLSSLVGVTLDQPEKWQSANYSLRSTAGNEILLQMESAGASLLKYQDQGEVQLSEDSHSRRYSITFLKDYDHQGIKQLFFVADLILRKFARDDFGFSKLDQKGTSFSYKNASIQIMTDWIFDNVEDAEESIAMSFIGFKDMHNILKPNEQYVDGRFHTVNTLVMGAKLASALKNFTQSTPKEAVKMSFKDISHQHLRTWWLIAGNALSMYTLFMSGAAYAFVKTLGGNVWIRVVNVNLCLTLLTAQGFMLGIDEVDDGRKCSALAVLLHYFQLTSGAWLLIKSFNLLSFKKSFRGSKLSPGKKTLIALGAYAVPAVYAGIVAAASVGKAYSSKNLCWLEGEYALTFVIPIELIAVIAFLTSTSTLIFALMDMKQTMRSIKRIEVGIPLNYTSSVDSVARMTTLAIHAGSSAIFALILAISWALTTTYTLYSTRETEISSAIANGLQGIFMLIIVVFRLEAFQPSGEMPQIAQAVNPVHAPPLSVTEFSVRLPRLVPVLRESFRRF